MLDRGDGRGQVAPAQFSFRSDRLALDYAATLMFRGPGPPSPLELLADSAALARWAHAAGLAEVETAGADELLDSAIAVREAIYALALARIAGGPLGDRDVAMLNQAASRPALGVALAASGALVRSGSLEQLIATIARDAIELLGGADAERLRQCSRDGCTRLFLDRSRGATRVWCGMRECGNRVNAAAYRRRRAAAR